MDQPTSSLLLLNPALRAYEAGQGRRTIELDDRDGRTMRLSVSAEAFGLLQRFRTPMSWKDLQDDLRDSGTDAARLPSIEQFLTQSCLARRILIFPDGDVHAAAQPARPAYMGFMLELIRPRIVNRLAAWMQHLFSPPLLLAGGFVVGAGICLMFHAMHAIPALPALSASQTLQVIGICAGGVLLHELGHAAAAYRLGARRVGIGVGWYAVMPVAYANLSEIWRYPPRDRVIVDVAGVYMQGLLLVALVALHHLWTDPVWLVAAAGTATSMLWNLNPLLRMDGYWIAADAFGVPDLRQRAARQLKRAIGGLMNKQAPSGPRESPFIALYGLLSAIFVFALVARALMFLGGTLVVSLSDSARQADVSTWPDLTAPEWTLLGLGVAWNVVLSCFVLRWLVSIPRRMAGWRSEMNGPNT